jgi:hemerythrin superfamily protein
MRDLQRLSPESSTTGGEDVLDGLERDHRHVEQLFAQASLLVGARRLAVVPQIVRALELHASIEEKIVYPAIEAAVGGGDVLIERAQEDHQEMKELLARVGGAELDDARLAEDLRALQIVVQSHVAVEEGEVFPAFRSVATDGDLRSLTGDAAKARAKGPDGSDLTPSAGDTVGPVDALRDLLTDADSPA